MLVYFISRANFFFPYKKGLLKFECYALSNLYTNDSCDWYKQEILPLDFCPFTLLFAHQSPKLDFGILRCLTPIRLLLYSIQLSQI